MFTELNSGKNLSGMENRNYTLHNLLTKTSRSQIFRAICQEDSKNVVIKTVDKHKYIVEFCILQRVKSINCNYLIEMLDIISISETLVGIVFPLYSTNLLDYIVSTKQSPMHVLKRIITEVTTGIACLHSNDIVHLDIKLENIMLDDSLTVKIIDFGYSEFMNGRKTLKRFCGSYSYVSPEQIQHQEYNPFKSDVWSLGILIFAILCNYLPFSNSTGPEDVKQIFENICMCHIFVPSYVLPKAKDLLLKMLNKTPELRITINEVLLHPWLNESKFELGNTLPIFLPLSNRKVSSMA